MTIKAIDELIHRTPDMSWLAHAACGDLPLEELEVYFVEAGRSIAPATIARCRSCPVRFQCLDHAYDHQIASGYFGGVSPSKRRSMSHADARASIS